MSNQIQLTTEPRTERGKGAAGRLRRAGRVPAIIYGYHVDPTPVSVAALDLYHALHTDAGRNVLIRIDLEGATHLTVARDVQMHPVRGDFVHVDLLAVDQNVPISIEIPVHLTDDEDVAKDGGIVNQVLYTVPILVRPLETPNSLDLSIAGMEIGDVRRVEDLRATLPEGAEFDIDPARTVITVNAPISEEALEALEESAGIEQDEPELIGEESEAEGDADDASTEEPDED